MREAKERAAKKKKTAKPRRAATKRSYTKLFESVSAGRVKVECRFTVTLVTLAGRLWRLSSRFVLLGSNPRPSGLSPAKVRQSVFSLFVACNNTQHFFNKGPPDRQNIY